MPLLPRPTGPRSLRPGCLGVAALPTSGPRTSFQKKEPFPVGGTVQGPGRAASAGRSYLGASGRAEAAAEAQAASAHAPGGTAAARARLTCTFIDDGRLPGPAR